MGVFLYIYNTIAQSIKLIEVDKGLDKVLYTEILFGTEEKTTRR